METENASAEVVLKNGNTVDLSLNVGRVMYGKSNGSDLGDLEGGPVSTMFLDPVNLGKTVWNVYQDRLNKAGVPQEDAWYEDLDSDLVRKIEAGMKKAIHDFFSWGPAMVQGIEAKIGQMSELTESPENQQSGPTSGEQQESSESIQTT